MAKAMDNYITLREAEKKERALQHTADNLNDFGTLTSLGASALYFTEKALGKEISKKLSTFSLVAVAVGMGAVITSFAVRHHAARVALNDDELLLLRNPALAQSQPVQDWSDRQSGPAMPSVQQR